MGMSTDNRFNNNTLLLSLIISVFLVILFIGKFFSLIDDVILMEILTYLALISLISIGLVIATLVDLKKNNIEVTGRKLLKCLDILGGYIVICGIMYLLSRTKDSKVLYLIFFDYVFTSLIFVSCLFYKRLYTWDRRTQWRLAVGNEKNQNTYHWRFNIRYGKARYAYSFSNIFKGVTALGLYIGFTFIYSIMVKGGEMSAIHVFIISIILVPLVARILESTFKLVFNFSGECSAYKVIKHRGGKPYKYIYIITDYENKREVKVNSRENLYIGEGEQVSLDFTLCTKRVMKRPTE